jgi:5-methylcytosine-specific restriction endonuclease McrA
VSWYRDRYLRTDHWRRARALALQRARFRCESCGAVGSGADNPLDVHHLRYRLWCETPADLMVLCRNCHQRAHWLQEVARILGRAFA